MGAVGGILDAPLATIGAKQQIDIIYRPTLEEVINYYTDDTFISFLIETCRLYRVVLVIPKTKHWRANWRQNEIHLLDDGCPDAIRKRIADDISEALSHVPRTDRPRFYPSFHQSIWRKPESRHQLRSRDYVFESDASSMKQAFEDMKALLDTIERHGLFYQLAFSGNRSLHVIVPAEAWPENYGGKKARGLCAYLLDQCGPKTHLLPVLRRMPYSLNEDTGGICLPILPSMLPIFMACEASVRCMDRKETTLLYEVRSKIGRPRVHIAPEEQNPTMSIDNQLRSTGIGQWVLAIISVVERLLLAGQNREAEKGVEMWEL